MSATFLVIDKTVSHHRTDGNAERFISKAREPTNVVLFDMRHPRPSSGRYSRTERASDTQNWI
jgi:hypothetical protein